MTTRLSIAALSLTLLATIVISLLGGSSYANVQKQPTPADVGTQQQPGPRAEKKGFVHELGFSLSGGTGGKAGTEGGDASTDTSPYLEGTYAVTYDDKFKFSALARWDIEDGSVKLGGTIDYRLDEKITVQVGIAYDTKTGGPKVTGKVTF